MGILTLGVPQKIVLELARLNSSNAFIETGTYHGGTTRWAANHFEIVHTIEKAESLYKQHGANLSEIENVTAHFGDSRIILPQIVENLDARTVVYWLDGHWSGGETAGEADECPLLGELNALKDRTRDIILIDDARLFLCAPPLPHDPSQWATVSEIFGRLPAIDRSFVQIVDDVIFIIPDEPDLRKCLTDYAQSRANDFWKKYGEIQRGQSAAKKSLKSRLAGIKRFLLD